MNRTIAGSGPGRPPIGPAFLIRFPQDLIDRVDRAAVEVQTSRAGWLRDTAEEQLAYPRRDLAALASWMVDEGLAGDVGYALAKPGKYQAELYCALHEISLPAMDDLSAQLASLDAANLPPGWTQEQTSPVDFLLRCPHEALLRDTIAERAGQVVACCPQGCTPPAGLTAQA